MEEELLRFLGRAFLLLHPKSMVANADASEDNFAKPDKKAAKTSGSTSREGNQGGPKVIPETLYTQSARE